MTFLRYAVVVHGPEAIDTGLVAQLISFLQRRGEVRTVMSGYTGVAAVVDAGLDDLIDISMRRVPSETLVKFNDWADVLILANSAKTPESAMRFGAIVHNRSLGRVTRPLMQVDRLAIILWSAERNEFADEVSNEMGRPVVDGVPLEPCEGEWRDLGGVITGENVWVNGVVVGRASRADVSIGKDSAGNIVARGIDLKPTGVARLGPYDPSTAHVRSGVVRRTSAVPRVIIGKGKGGVHLIDHAAERAIYHCRGASLVVTIGDDTSRTAGSVLARFGVPIVAIIDGDEDGITNDRTLIEGSVILRMRPGTDDLVGRDVRKELFDEGSWIDVEMSPDEMVEKIIPIAADRLVDRDRYVDLPRKAQKVRSSL
ncbi:MAG: DUF2117 domain-containing protein [Euryarchaeota archaeon]|nr:DUF2117 domain-containing protein [Euryarchaeota archaeon]